jgi:hypothetical protein
MARSRGRGIGKPQILDETKAFLRNVRHGDDNCAVRFRPGGRLDTKQPEALRGFMR